MRVIALIGLMSIEKIQLTVDLATHFTWHTDQSVTVIDNVARMAIDPVQLNAEPLIRIDGDITKNLMDILVTIQSDLVLVAVSETAELDQLFIALDFMTDELPHIALTTVGLIDLRTCDCFPNLREKLEDYADVHFLAPFDVNEVLEVI